MIFAHITHSLRHTFPTRASEWALGLMLFNWSVVLIFNPNLFAELPNYSHFTEIMSQGSWAALCFIGGTLRLTMLFINGTWRRSPHLRAAAAFLSCFFWFQVSLALFQSGLFATGLAVYPVLFLLDVYNVFRASRDAGFSDSIKTGADNGTDA